MAQTAIPQAQHYVERLKEYLPNSYVAVLQSPQVVEAVEADSVDLVCFRVLAGLARRESELRRDRGDRDNHSSALRGLAYEVTVTALPYSEEMYLRSATRSEAPSDGEAHPDDYKVIAFKDDNIAALFSGDALVIHRDRTTNRTSPVSNRGSFGYYHGQGSLADRCEQAERIIRERPHK